MTERVHPTKGKPRPAEVRERISRGVSRALHVRRERERVTRADLARLQRPGAGVAASILPFVAMAQRELDELVEALGGDDCSPQRRIIAEDTARVGLVLRATLAHFVQSADGEAAARVGTLARARAASLAQIGLDPVSREESLTDYLARWSAEHETPAPAAGSANGAKPEASVEAEADRSAGGDDGREPSAEGAES